MRVGSQVSGNGSHVRGRTKQRDFDRTSWARPLSQVQTVETVNIEFRLPMDRLKTTMNDQLERVDLQSSRGSSLRGTAVTVTDGFAATSTLSNRKRRWPRLETAASSSRRETTASSSRGPAEETRQLQAPSSVYSRSVYTVCTAVYHGSTAVHHASTAVYDGSTASTADPPWKYSRRSDENCDSSMDPSRMYQ